MRFFFHNFLLHFKKTGYASLKFKKSNFFAAKTEPGVVTSRLQASKGVRKLSAVFRESAFFVHSFANLPDLYILSGTFLGG